MGGEKLSEVKFAYTNQQGKQTTSTIKVQQGMNIVFGGYAAVEQGNYHIGSDGAVYNEKGDKIDVIRTTKEQMAALQGMSMAYEESGSDPMLDKFILTEEDINHSGFEDEIYKSSLHINMRENALGGNKKTTQYEARTEAGSGVYKTTLRGEGYSTVSVSSDKTLAEAKRARIEAWKREHYIQNWLYEKTGWEMFAPKDEEEE